MVDLVGVPYAFGGRRAGEGLDTVGVILNVYKKVWIDLPDSEEELATVGKLVDREAVTEGRLLTGDLAFVAALDRTLERVRLRPLLVVWPGVVMLSTRSTGKVTFARLDQFAAGLRMVRRVIPADGPICRQTEDKFSPHLPGSASRVAHDVPQGVDPNRVRFSPKYLDQDDPDLMIDLWASGSRTKSQAQDVIDRANRKRESQAAGLQASWDSFWNDSPATSPGRGWPNTLSPDSSPWMSEENWSLGAKRGHYGRRSGGSQ
jgi:hypothetical protein